MKTPTQFFDLDLSGYLAARLQSETRTRAARSFQAFQRTHPQARPPKGYEWLEDRALAASETAQEALLRRARMALVKR